MGISTSTDNNERQPPSPESDRRARMYYAAARYYTALQGIPLRSPHRLLDVEPAHRGFVFAKRQGLEVPFYMSLCLRGWGSKWHDLEVESHTELRNTLAEHLTLIRSKLAAQGLARNEQVKPEFSHAWRGPES